MNIRIELFTVTKKTVLIPLAGWICKGEIYLVNICCVLNLDFQAALLNYSKNLIISRWNTHYCWISKSPANFLNMQIPPSLITKINVTLIFFNLAKFY